jgi:hypothetical protein
VVVVLDQFTRRLVGFGVDAGDVTAVDLCCMFNTPIRGQGVPRHLGTITIPSVEAHRWQANLPILDIDFLSRVAYCSALLTAPPAPHSNIPGAAAAVNGGRSSRVAHTPSASTRGRCAVLSGSRRSSSRVCSHSVFCVMHQQDGRSVCSTAALNAADRIIAPVVPSLCRQQGWTAPSAPGD